jgi:predicted TIM-barrel fold metal-dependent hydrolase
MPEYDPNPNPPIVPVPANACDVHAHVLGPASRYPFQPERVYTPPDTSPAEYRAMLDALGIERGVLVQPSVHGFDNRPLLDALATYPARLRGVAAVPFDVELAELERLHAAGVRGVRCNIVDVRDAAGRLPLDELRALARRIAALGWHVELLLHVDAFPDLDRQLADFPVAVVFGHLGYVPTERGMLDPGFQAMLRLLQAGRAWVKLTAPYRLTRNPMPYPDVEPFARALVDAAPERLLWGSDWPHVHIRTAMPNDGDLFNLFARWVPDSDLRRQVLVDHPAQVYDF